MANFGSRRNLIVLGGLAVFALGWGGGVLLGVLRPPRTSTPENKAPQVVDADDFAPDSEPTSLRKSSSLLEQVFGLEDLEEEKPSRPRPQPNPAPSSDAVRPDVAGETNVDSDVGEVQEPAPEPAKEVPPVVLEELKAEEGKPPGAQTKEDDLTATEPPEGAVEKADSTSPKKEFLDDNPYK